MIYQLISGEVVIYLAANSRGGCDISAYLRGGCDISANPGEVVIYQIIFRGVCDISANFQGRL